MNVLIEDAQEEIVRPDARQTVPLQKSSTSLSITDSDQPHNSGRKSYLDDSDMNIKYRHSSIGNSMIDF